MKLYLNPEYEELRNDLLKIAEGKYAANKVFCHKRNVVEKVTIQGKEYVVKTYKRPNFFNRFAYTYLRKSKAERAYMHAKELLRLGIDTPCPVAYMEKMRKGLFNKGYYVSEYLPYRLMHDAYTELGEHDKEKLTKDFMDFTIEMHDKKILPLDFNSSNIFYHFDEEEVKEGDTRVVMHFHPALAPIKICVMPLSKQLSEQTTELYTKLCKHYRCEYDEAGSIGKRYRRQDAVGTPLCITYDFDSEADQSVTVRDRDTMQQVRVKIADLPAYLEKVFEF